MRPGERALKASEPLVASGLLGRTFIVVWEGTDGSGKTALMNEVAGILREKGHVVSSYKTPSDSETGRIAKRRGNSEGRGHLSSRESR